MRRFIRPALRLLLPLALGPITPAVARAQAVAEVQVAPETLTLGIGERKTVFATAFDAKGNVIPQARFTFWSSDTAVASVGRDGTVQGIRAGKARIEARIGGRRAPLAVQVVPLDARTAPAPGDSVLTRNADPADTVASAPASRTAGTLLSLDPPSIYLLPAETARLEPRALHNDGSPADPVRLTWRSLRPEVATVNDAGLVVGVSAGQGTIAAQAPGGLSATAPVIVAQAELALAREQLVLAPGGTDTMRVVVPSQNGREVRSGLAWRSSDTTIVRVGPTGIVQGLQPGTADVVVTGYFQERAARVTVHRVPVSLVVSPRLAAGPVELPLRATRQFTAQAEAADSTPIPEARIDWTIGDTLVATFDPATGTATARAAGTTTLTARLAGFPPATWQLVVIPGRVGIARERLGIGLGARDSVAAALLDDAGGATGPVPQAEWRSSRPDVVAVGNDGVVVGNGLGRATLTVSTPWGQRDSLDVFVVADLLVSSNRGGAGYGIYQLRAAAPDSFAPVLVDSATNIHAALSPDRTRIAFVASPVGARGGPLGLRVMDADGRNARRLATGEATAQEPVWTPDGERLVYSASRPAASGVVAQIYVLRADGSDSIPRVLTSSAGGNTSPAVSPDGRTIAFVSMRDGNHEIYLMNADGSAQRRLTSTAGRESAPRFFPNGDLAYVVERGGGSAGSRIVRVSLGAGAKPITLLDTDRPITGFGLSRDGARLACVVSSLSRGGRGAAEFAFFLAPAEPGATPVPVRLAPGEQIVSPTF